MVRFSLYDSKGLMSRCDPRLLRTMMVIKSSTEYFQGSGCRIVFTPVAVKLSALEDQVHLFNRVIPKVEASIAQRFIDIGCRSIEVTLVCPDCHHF